MSFGPKKIVLTDVLINSLGALIAGFIGSLILLTIVFVSSKIISIPNTFSSARLDESLRSPMFPFVLSFITFFTTMVSFFIATKVLHMTDPTRYKKSRIAYGQIGIFWILTYLCITPIYIFMGVINYDNIMLIFIIHCLILSFWTSLILEILNNYRYILVGYYWNFFALFVTSMMTVVLFISMPSGSAKLFSLLLMLPLILLGNTLFKGLFELLYYHYHNFSNTDPLGDIFYQIEHEEQEALREEALKNSI